MRVTLARGTSTRINAIIIIGTLLDSGTHWCFNIEKSDIALALGKVIVQNEARQRLRFDLFQSRQTICLKIKTWKVSKTDICTCKSANIFQYSVSRIQTSPVE